MRESRCSSTSKPTVFQIHFAEFDEEPRSCKPCKRSFSSQQQEDVLARHPIFRLDCDRDSARGKPEQSFRIDQQRSLEPGRNLEGLRDLTREYLEKLQTILAVGKPSADLLHNLRHQIGAQVRPEVQVLVMHALRLSIKESVLQGRLSDSGSTSPSN